MTDPIVLYREIPLSRGKVALVDDADHATLSAFKWHAVRSRRAACDVWYAARWAGDDYVYMHRLLLGFPPGDVDHVDGDGLHNWRDNLRQATHRQNVQNRRHNPTGKTSPYKGVSWDEYAGSWKAQIRVPGRTSAHIGRFDTEVEAALAYDRAAREHFGEFAAPNFPESKC